MAEPAVPHVSLRDWIEIGPNRIPAIVSHLYPPEYSAACEAVFLDARNRATNHDMVWKDGRWDFAERPDYGGYADKYSRLAEYVELLRQGRPRPYRTSSGQ